MQWIMVVHLINTIKNQAGKLYKSGKKQLKKLTKPSANEVLIQHKAFCFTHKQVTEHCF